MKRYLLLLACCLMPLAQAETVLPVLFDFETGNLQGWQIVNGTFGPLVTSRAFEHNRPKTPYSKQGNYFLSTLETKEGRPSDSFQGIVESPIFILTRPEISLRVGGGSSPDVGVSLHTLEGRQVARFTGKNSEELQLHQASFPLLVNQPLYLRITDLTAQGWGHVTLDDVRAHAEINTPRTLDATKKKQEIKQAIRSVCTTSSLAQAIDELDRRFPEQYPAAYLRAELATLSDQDPLTLQEFAHKALVTANPLLANTPIVFCTRAQFRLDHHNSATMFQTGEINTRSYNTKGQLKILYPAAKSAITLLNPGPNATVRDPEIDSKARKIVFSMRRDRNDDYHLYTLDLETAKLTQLTHAPGISDIDPMFLPDGSIVFTSTRQPKYCQCNRHIMGNLFRMNHDGSNVLQIGKSTLHEGHPTLLADGRILYDRWEYVDRNFGDAQGLWTCNPDGTRHAVFWGNNTQSPGGVIDARPIPGKPTQVIAVLASCHDRPWGALGLIDRAIDVDGPDPFLHVWPSSFKTKIAVNRFGYDSTLHLPVKYEDPYPLDDAHFLCVRTTGKGEQTAITYLDLFGNEIFLHTEKEGCFDPIPLKPQSTKPEIVTQRDFTAPDAPAYAYIHDVYNGTHTQGIKRGSIRYLRVVEAPEKRTWSRYGWQGQGEQAPAMNWHNFESKRILGTVPVYPDGSAYFELPANTFVFFQTLDQNGQMIQSMRSGAYLQPGEKTGCVGCHDNRLTAPPAARQPNATQALQRPPAKLNGWNGQSPKLFSFQEEVQPIFNKFCLDCHDYGQKAADKLNLAPDRDFVFSTSYTDLWVTRNVSCVGGGPATIQNPYSWGSHASKLTRKLNDNHHGKTIPEADKRIIYTWLDLNAPYYPTYDCAFPDHPAGRSPLSREEINTIAQLSGVTPATQHYQRQRAQFSFDRPERSRILQAPKLAANPQARQQVLELIQTAAKRLQQQPRADMPGFQLTPSAQKQHHKYERQEQRERQTYDAIRQCQSFTDITSQARDVDK